MRDLSAEHRYMMKSAEQLFAECRGNKHAVALACGYLPAALAWESKSTYGLPLAVIADFAASKHLTMDWYGIELEAIRSGADVRGEIEEAKLEVERRCGR